jgi:hypothetical protein
LRALAKSFKEESWPGEDVRAAMEKIKAWWLHDWPDLSNDISLVNELQDELWSGSTVLTLFLAQVASDASLTMLLDEVRRSTGWMRC